MIIPKEPIGSIPRPLELIEAIKIKGSLIWIRLSFDQTGRLKRTAGAFAKDHEREVVDARWHSKIWRENQNAKVYNGHRMKSVYLLGIALLAGKMDEIDTPARSLLEIGATTGWGVAVGMLHAARLLPHFDIAHAPVGARLIAPLHHL